VTKRAKNVCEITLVRRHGTLLRAPWRSTSDVRSRAGWSPARARRRSPLVPLRKGTPRKEVIQPHVPVRLPCYDFTPITDPTLDGCLPAPRSRVGPPHSSLAGFRGVTGGVYKARERIHRTVLTRGY
jgi:hypothetical protein